MNPLKDLLPEFRKRGLSIPTMLILTKPLEGIDQKSKEEVADQILKIIRSSKTEQEMVEKANSFWG